MYGAIKTRQGSGGVTPQSPGICGTERVSSIAECIDLIKEQEVVTGEPGREFTTQSIEGPMHLDWDGEWLKVDCPNHDVSGQFTLVDFGSSKLAEVILRDGLYTAILTIPQQSPAVNHH